MAHASDEQLVETLEKSGASHMSEDDVAAYLLSNPTFFEANAEVLSAMRLPGRFAGGGEDRGGVVDFQQVILNQQKETLSELRTCVSDIIETTRSNMSVQGRTHVAVLAMLMAHDFEELVRVVIDDLALHLDLDVVGLAFETPAQVANGWQSQDIGHLPEGLVDGLLGNGRPVRLFSEIEDDGTLFGAASDLVRSAALARVGPGEGLPTGLLALGSREPDFQPGQGTELISFLAQVLELCLKRFAAASRR